jgi:uncharacterized protein
VVRPGSRKPGVSLSDELEVEIRVAERAHDGRANIAARKVLAVALKVPYTSIVIVRGQTARHKLLSIDGLSQEEIITRLARSRAATSAL